MKKQNKGSTARGSKKQGFLESFNARPTKGNITNTGLKTLIDVLLGATVGAGLGAVSGKQAKWVGLGMIGLGHYFGDQSGMLRVAGASAIAYGIAKHFENEELAGTVQGITLAGETEKAKTRLTQFKDEVMGSYYLDKIFKKADSATSTDSDQAVGAIDLSSLDFFDQFNQQEADEFELEQETGQRSLPNYETEDFSAPSSDEMSYAIIDDEPDFTDM